MQTVTTTLPFFLLDISCMNKKNNVWNCVLVSHATCKLKSLRCQKSNRVCQIEMFQGLYLVLHKNTHEESKRLFTSSSSLKCTEIHVHLLQFKA